MLKHMSSHWKTKYQDELTSDDSAVSSLREQLQKLQQDFLKEKEFADSLRRRQREELDNKLKPAASQEEHKSQSEPDSMLLARWKAHVVGKKQEHKKENIAETIKSSDEEHINKEADSEEMEETKERVIQQTREFVNKEGKHQSIVWNYTVKKRAPGKLTVCTRVHKDSEDDEKTAPPPPDPWPASEPSNSPHGDMDEDSVEKQSFDAPNWAAKTSKRHVVIELGPDLVQEVPVFLESGHTSSDFQPINIVVNRDGSIEEVIQGAKTDLSSENIKKLLPNSPDDMFKNCFFFEDDFYYVPKVENNANVVQLILLFKEQSVMKMVIQPGKPQPVPSLAHIDNNGAIVLSLANTILPANTPQPETVSEQENMSTAEKNKNEKTDNDSINTAESILKKHPELVLLLRLAENQDEMYVETGWSHDRKRILSTTEDFIGGNILDLIPHGVQSNKPLDSSEDPANSIISKSSKNEETLTIYFRKGVNNKGLYLETTWNKSHKDLPDTMKSILKNVGKTVYSNRGQRGQKLTNNVSKETVWLFQQGKTQEQHYLEMGWGYKYAELPSHVKGIVDTSEKKVKKSSQDRQCAKDTGLLAYSRIIKHAEGVFVEAGWGCRVGDLPWHIKKLVKKLMVTTNINKTTVAWLKRGQHHSKTNYSRNLKGKYFYEKTERERKKREEIKRQQEKKRREKKRDLEKEIDRTKRKLKIREKELQTVKDLTKDIKKLQEKITKNNTANLAKKKLKLRRKEEKLRLKEEEHKSKKELELEIKKLKNKLKSQTEKYDHEKKIQVKNNGERKLKVRRKQEDLKQKENHLKDKENVIKETEALKKKLLKEEERLTRMKKQQKGKVAEKKINLRRKQEKLKSDHEQFAEMTKQRSEQMHKEAAELEMKKKKHTEKLKDRHKKLRDKKGQMKEDYEQRICYVNEMKEKLKQEKKDLKEQKKQQAVKLGNKRLNLRRKGEILKEKGDEKTQETSQLKNEWQQLQKEERDFQSWRQKKEMEIKLKERKCNSLKTEAERKFEKYEDEVLKLRDENEKLKEMHHNLELEWIKLQRQQEEFQSSADNSHDKHRQWMKGEWNKLKEQQKQYDKEENTKEQEMDTAKQKEHLKKVEKYHQQILQMEEQKLDQDLIAKQKPPKCPRYSPYEDVSPPARVAGSTCSRKGIHRKSAQKKTDEPLEKARSSTKEDDDVEKDDDSDEDVDISPTAWPFEQLSPFSLNMLRFQYLFHPDYHQKQKGEIDWGEEEEEEEEDTNVEPKTQNQQTRTPVDRMGGLQYPRTSASHKRVSTGTESILPTVPLPTPPWDPREEKTPAERKKEMNKKPEKLKDSIPEDDEWDNELDLEDIPDDLFDDEPYFDDDDHYLEDEDLDENGAIPPPSKEFLSKAKQRQQENDNWLLKRGEHREFFHDQPDDDWSAEDDDEEIDEDLSDDATWYMKRMQGREDEHVARRDNWFLERGDQREYLHHDKKHN